MTCEKRWDEMRRAEMRWEELTGFEMRWSVGCDVQVWSVKCGVWRVPCEVWRKSSLGVALHRGRAHVMFLDNNTATASHKARPHAGTTGITVIYPVVSITGWGPANSMQLPNISGWILWFMVGITMDNYRITIHNYITIDNLMLNGLDKPPL